MKRTILRHLFLAGAVCLGLSVAHGQTTADKYLISVEAGGVNYLDGDVTVSHPGGTGGRLLTGDKVKAGDRVTTADDSQAEILLNPGSYLRLGENSTFLFRSTSLDDLRVTLEKGSAIFEVVATNQFRVSIFTPKSRVMIIQSGVFRIDLGPNGTGTLSAINGDAIIGDKAPFILKEGRKGNLDGSPVVAEKFDRGKGDLFSMWSKERSKQLTNMAKNFNSKVLQNSLMGIGFSRYSCRIGFWAFSASIGTSFIPCYDGFDSPYGWGYRRSSWGYNPYYPIYNPSNNNSDFKSGSVPSNSAAPSAPVSMPAPAAATAPTTVSKGGSVVDH